MEYAASPPSLRIVVESRVLRYDRSLRKARLRNPALTPEESRSNLREPEKGVE
jgi:hypothetical protein